MIQAINAIHVCMSLFGLNKERNKGLLSENLFQRVRYTSKILATLSDKGPEYSILQKKNLNHDLKIILIIVILIY